MFFGAIESICCRGQWVFVGDLVSHRKVAVIQENLLEKGGKPYRDYVLNGPDGIIAKFENFAVKEYLEDGILSRIKVNGHTYGLGEVVNGRLVTQIATHQEASPYARIPQFVLMALRASPCFRQLDSSQKMAAARSVLDTVDAPPEHKKEEGNHR